MELAEVIGTIYRRRIAVGIVVVVAVLAALLTTFRIGGSGLHARASESGSATAQMMVDGPRSAIGDLRQDTLPLVARAGVFAQYMSSAELRNAIARRVGIPPAQLITSGPFPGDTSSGSTPPPSAARGDQVLGEKEPYRLDFAAQTDLPLVTIVARAPKPAIAAQMADATVEAVRNAVTALQTQEQIQPGRRVVVRELGPAEPATVSSGPGKILAVLAFLGVLIIGLLAIVGLSRIGAPALVEDDVGLWDFADDDEPEPAPVAFPRRQTDGVAS